MLYEKKKLHVILQKYPLLISGIGKINYIIERKM